MILQLQHQTGGSLRQICQALGLPRSSFHRGARPSLKGREDARMGGLIEEIFKRHRRRYGYRRIQRELADRATVCVPAACAASCDNEDCAPSSPRTTCPKPAMAGRTAPVPTCWPWNPLPHSLTRLGPGTSPSSPRPAAGFTLRWSLTWVRAALWAGVWPTTCAQNSSFMPCSRPCRPVPKPVGPSSTATGQPVWQPSLPFHAAAWRAASKHVGTRQPL